MASISLKTVEQWPNLMWTLGFKIVANMLEILDDSEVRYLASETQILLAL